MKNAYQEEVEGETWAHHTAQDNSKYRQLFLCRTVKENRDCSFRIFISSELILKAIKSKHWSKNIR